MARRKSPQLMEALIELSARLPWWASALGALLAYGVLHSIAIRPQTLPTTVGGLGSQISGAMWLALAQVGQYLVPGLLVIGGITSLWHRRDRAALAQQVRAAPAADALNGMRWQEFERVVGEAFRMQGYAVEERGGAGADGGVDLVLRKDGEKFLVQCKQWRAYKVGVTVVRELYGVMAAQGAAGGFVVTSGVYTEEAVGFAQGRNVKLIDGACLKEWIGLVRPDRAGVEPTSGREPTSAKPTVSRTEEQSPACPVCQSRMVLRQARQGKNAGRKFWGCVRYPDCRGLRSAS